MEEANFISILNGLHTCIIILTVGKCYIEKYFNYFCRITAYKQRRILLL
jgi:hypothetical protein